MAWDEPLQALDRAKADSGRDPRHRRVQIGTEAPVPRMEAFGVDLWRPLSRMSLKRPRFPMRITEVQWPINIRLRDSRRMLMNIGRATGNELESSHSNDLEAIQTHVTRQGTHGQSVQSDVHSPAAETVGTVRSYGSATTSPGRAHKKVPQVNPGRNTLRGTRLHKYGWPWRRHSNKEKYRRPNPPTCH